jgi:hypothetical protein
MEREFQKNNCLYCPHHISSATPLYLSEHQSRTWVRNRKKKKKKKTLKDKGTTGTVKSKSYFNVMLR